MMFSEIGRRLVQVEAWTYVFFTSSLVGLVSFAFSSLFTSIIEKWRWWTVFIYIVIICCVVFFVKLFESSANTSLKHHLSLFLWVISTIWSYIFDKKTEKLKLDIYILISHVAFCIMSATLSRGTYSGFGICLLQMFSTCLALELMKIEKWFFVFGLGFGYILCLFFPTEQPRQGIVVGHDIVENSQSTQRTDNDLGIVDNSQDNGVESNSDIDESSQSPQDNSIDNGPNMSQLLGCVKSIEEEKNNLIAIVSRHMDEHITTSVTPDINLVLDFMRGMQPLGSFDDLQNAVKGLVNHGGEFKSRCCDVYISWRKQFLQECLFTRNLQEINTRTWIKVGNIAARILFPNEKVLCHHLFQGFPSVANNCFTEICKDLTDRLVGFVNKYSYENSERNIVDCIEASKYLFPELELLFHDQSLKSELRTTRMKLRDATRDILVNLEKRICQDMANMSVPVDGSIHGITRQVMNCLCSFNHQLLISVLDSTIQLLESTLGAMDEYDPVPGLRYVFVINNLRYIGHRVEHSEVLRDLLGDIWFQKNIAKVEYSLQLYRSGQWDYNHLLLGTQQMDELVAEREGK